MPAFFGVPFLPTLLSRRLLFVGGKGGVGKTHLAQAIAHLLASQGLRTLWVTLEDPSYPLDGVLRQHISQAPTTLHHLNIEVNHAFEEYIGLKLGALPLAKLFVGNRLVRYLSQAAPGLHDLVLLGKIWYERQHYDRIVVDLPSTGYGLSLFQSPANFARLFQGGPIQKDAQAMLQTLGDPQTTHHLVLALPEEMPIQEALEMKEHLAKLFPHNPAQIAVNRALVTASEVRSARPDETPEAAVPLFIRDAKEYVRLRKKIESKNLQTLLEQNPTTVIIPSVTPSRDLGQPEHHRVIEELVRALSEALREEA